MARSKKVRSKKQVATDRRALKKLYAAGLIKKPNLNRKPTPTQRRTINKFKAVIEGKAAVVTPKNPSKYKKNKTYKVVGKKVIVPKRKNERISINREGRIVHKRRTAGVTTRGEMKPPSEIKPTKRRVVYAIPVGSGDNLKWFRFSKYQTLLSFLAEFSKPYKNPDQYILEEELQEGETFNPRGEKRVERNNKLDDRLELRLRGRRIARERSKALSLIGEDLI